MAKSNAEDVEKLTQRISELQSKLNIQSPSTVILPPAPEPPPTNGELQETSDPSNSTSATSSEDSSSATPSKQNETDINKCQSSEQIDKSDSTDAGGAAKLVTVVDTPSDISNSAVSSDTISTILKGHSDNNSWCTKCQGQILSENKSLTSQGDKSNEVSRLQERLQELELELTRWQDEVTLLQKKEAAMKLQLDSAASTMCNSPADSPQSSPQHIPTHPSITALLYQVKIFIFYLV